MYVYIRWSIITGVGIETTTDTPPTTTTDGTATPGSKRKRAHEVRDPNAPKRPSTAYIFFSTEMRPKIRDDYPDLTLSERSKLMGKLWANLEQGKKQVREWQTNKQRKSNVLWEERR